MRSFKFNILFLALFAGTWGYSQNQNVGIGTTTPDPSSALEIQSTTGGLLIPRMLESQRTAISNPATGLMVYQTNSPEGFYYYDGSGTARLNLKGKTYMRKLLISL